MSPVAVLVGPPGSGKTTVGRALAARLGLDFHDTDAAVEQTDGRAIADIFLESGEATFRTLERAAVAAALTEQPGIVALGGGAVMDPINEDSLAGHAVVFLDVGIADAAQRIGFDRSRPLLTVNPRASWVALMEQRRPIYQRVARYRVDTAGRDVDEIVEEIAEQLASEDS